MAAALQQDKGGILLPDKPGIERKPITGPETERKRTGEPLPRYPSLYQINTRVWLTELSRGLHRTATLDDIPDADLDHFAESGFDWIWFLSVWQTGPEGQKVSRTNPEWRKEFLGNTDRPL
jgi:hypothetical protein